MPSPTHLLAYLRNGMHKPTKDFLGPIFLDQLNLPSDWTYMFSMVDLLLSIFIVIVFIAFGALYCVLAEIFPKVTMLQREVFRIYVAMTKLIANPQDIYSHFF